jgi:hypothetical protein
VSVVNKLFALQDTSLSRTMVPAMIVAMSGKFVGNFRSNCCTS